MSAHAGYRGTPLQRFWAKVHVDENGCWLWTAGKTKDGYGVWRPTKSEPTQSVHRWAFEMFVGPIPDGEEIGHTCEPRHCCNPDHLQPMTHEKNMLMARQTHCKHGHPLEGENLYVFHNKKTGFVARRCRTCGRDAQRRYQAGKT